MKIAGQTRGFIAAALLICAGGVAFGATLSLGEPASVEDLIALPVLLHPGAHGAVASLQFDLAYNSACYTVTAVDLGTAAGAAGKQVMFDVQGESVRIVVAGFNQETIAAGEVAILYLSPETTHLPTDAYGLQNAVLADPMGQSIPVTVQESGKQETGNGNHSSSTGRDTDSSADAAAPPDNATTNSPSSKSGASDSSGETPFLSDSPDWPGGEDGRQSAAKAKSSPGSVNPSGMKSTAMPAHTAFPGSPTEMPGAVPHLSRAKNTGLAGHGRVDRHAVRNASPHSSDTPPREKEISDAMRIRVANAGTGIQQNRASASSLLHNGQRPALGNQPVSLTTMTAGDKMRLEIIGAGVLIGLAVCLLGLYRLHRIFR